MWRYCLLVKFIFLYFYFSSFHVVYYATHVVNRGECIVQAPVDSVNTSHKASQAEKHEMPEANEDLYDIQTWWKVG